MNALTPQELIAEKVQLLSLFKTKIRRWFNGEYGNESESELRSEINRSVQRVCKVVRDS
jgi:hypothetical protein